MVLNQHERQHNKIYLLCLETREFINSLLASNNFYRLLMAFANDVDHSDLFLKIFFYFIYFLLYYLYIFFYFLLLLF